MTEFQFLDTQDDIVYAITTDTEEHAWMELCDIVGTEYAMDNMTLL